MASCTFVLVGSFKATSIRPMSFANPSCLFEPVEPFNCGVLPLQDGHRVYYEQCGNPKGVPVIFLHGGPGSACSARHRQLFNPATTRAILFDQRGCGRSTADHDPMHANTTGELIGDIERLRRELGIAQWLVVGGSWGAGLALAYAAEHPGACLGLVLRAVFLSRPSDLHWFFCEARQFLPDAWAEFAKFIPEHHDGDPGQAVFKTVLGTDTTSAIQLARAWNAWESALELRRPRSQVLGATNAQSTDVLLAKYRLQSHYLRNRCFFPTDGLLQQLAGMRHLPVDLVHGRLDWVCRPEASWTLHQALPSSALYWVDQAGHGLFEPEMTQAFVAAISRRVSAIDSGH